MKNSKVEFLTPILNEGEVYAGLLLGKNGEPDQHIILLQGEALNVSWDDAKRFANDASGRLPTRREQSLLIANLPEEFTPNWYWSCEQRGSGSAWVQNFLYGRQSWSYTNDRFRARAVRSIAI